MPSLPAVVVKVSPPSKLIAINEPGAAKPATTTPSPSFLISVDPTLTGTGVNVAVAVAVGIAVSVLVGVALGVLVDVAVAVGVVVGVAVGCGKITT